MALGITLPILSIAFGIFILVFPKFLRYILALYFIIAGILGFF